ncbi:hypothetical protein GRX03_03415 [Halovenus sp. WSH3]|uniref:SHOCT domain-containing protein n=1 Tax=Halovenus carboxidivorans TaxID=2692199 RepID=A0A6B0SY33_9EURY|nr:PH domain-containing protein [Halovenus carboxidivorans]MXR50658.1 hypothetical protein [Halovenus carboxidivorans]
MGLFGSSGDDDPMIENADLNCSPQNEYVTEANVAKIDHVLDQDEKVHFLANGTGLDIRAPDDDVEKGTAKNVLTAATDRRVVFRVWKALSRDNEITVPYNNISGVEYRGGVVKKTITLRATPNTYKFGAEKINEEERQKMAQFIREMAHPSSDAAENNPEQDPLSKLERLRDLHEDGVITEEELEQKKSELLDQI